MKKLFTVSLVAIMAVSAAHADIASTGYVDGKTGNLTFTPETAAAGATDLTAAVNAVAGAVKDVAAGNLTISQGQIKDTMIESVSAAKVNGDLTNATIALDNVTGKGALAGQDTVTQNQVEGLSTALGNKQDKLNATNVQTDGTGNVIVSVAAADGVVTVGKGTLGTGDITGLNTALNDKEDVSNKKNAITEDMTDTQKQQYYPTISLMETQITNNTNTLAGNVGDMTTLEEHNENYTDLVTTVIDLDNTKQEKSTNATSDYMVGKKDGTWQALNANLPTKCGGEGVTCALISVGGNISWEVVAQGTAN